MSTEIPDGFKPLKRGGGYLTSLGPWYYRIDESKAKHAAYEETVFYLDEVRRDIVEHVEDFLPSEGEPSPTDSISTLRIIWEVMISTCLSSMLTFCER